MSLNAAFAFLSACGLQVAGLPVVYFGCKSGMSRCVLGTDRDQPLKLPPCKGCIAESQRLFAHAPVLWFTYEENAHLDQLLTIKSVEELSRFTHSLPGSSSESAPIPLGELTLPSLRWALRRHHLQDDESTRFLFRQYILSAWNVAKEFGIFLDKAEPDVVVVFNGILFTDTGLISSSTGWIRDAFGATAGNNWLPDNQIPVGMFDSVADNMLQFADSATGRPDQRADHLPSCNMAIARADFQHIGGFPVIRFTACEDVMFCETAKDAWPEGLRFVNGMRVKHLGRGRLMQYWRHQEQFGYCRAALNLRLRNEHRRLGRIAT